MSGRHLCGLNRRGSGFCRLVQDDVPEDLVQDFGPAYYKVVVSFFDDMGRFCQADREDFIPGAMDMIEALRHFRVYPFQYGVERPAYETVISCPDDIKHETSVCGGVHSEGMFCGGCGFQ